MFANALDTIEKVFRSQCFDATANSPTLSSKAQSGGVHLKIYLGSWHGEAGRGAAGRGLEAPLNRGANTIFLPIAA